MWNGFWSRLVPRVRAGAQHSQSPIDAEGRAVIGIMWHTGLGRTVHKCTQLKPGRSIGHPVPRAVGLKNLSVVKSNWDTQRFDFQHRAQIRTLPN